MLSGKAMEMVGQREGKARGENACVCDDHEAVTFHKEPETAFQSKFAHPAIHPSIQAPIMCQALFWVLSHKQQRNKAKTPKSLSTGMFALVGELDHK